MTTDVVVADYGIGNLLSVRRALEHCGATVEMSDDPQRVMDADRLVVPASARSGIASASWKRAG